MLEYTQLYQHQETLVGHFSAYRNWIFPEFCFGKVKKLTLHIVFYDQILFKTNTGQLIWRPVQDFILLE
jgi:hypothetical protein